MSENQSISEPSSLLDVNLTDNSTRNATASTVTPSSIAVAYTSIVIMALIPIYLGSYRSLKFLNKSKSAETETISKRDAAMFPLIASCFLFGVYIFFKVFSKEYINLLLTIYFFALGIAALAHLVAKPLSKLWPSIIPNTFYRLDITSSPKPIPDPQSSPSPSTGSTELSPSSNTERFTIDFDTRLILSIGLCSLIGISYLIKKHWLVNNLFGLAFAVNAIELIRLNTVSTAAILLGGLFVYDVFWVFGTEVMVSVAKNFEAPIKLVFPQNLLGAGLLGNDTQMAMLGLGDIVVPGILVALMLRFDVRAGHGRAYYFWTTFWAYLAGLLTTIAVMHFFKHAQPALLYLVPACLLTPFACALVRGEIAALINYADEPEADAEKQKKAQ